MKRPFAKDLLGYKNQVGKQVIADFQKAWIKYTERGFYRTAVVEMQKHGMKQPYIDNILKLAFMDGYNIALEQTTNP